MRHRVVVAAAVALAVATAAVPAGSAPDPTSGDHGGTSRWADTDVPVELVTDGLTDPASATDAVAEVGGRVLDVTPSGLVLARVPAARLAALRDLTAAYVRAPVRLDVRPQRTSRPDDLPAGGAPRSAMPTAMDTTGADRWHEAGFSGAGVRVGVIDFFNVPAYWDVERMGPEPVPGVTARCFDVGADCSTDFFSNSPQFGDDHGPAVVEIIREIAPDAEILIGRATTESDYYALIDWFADNDVRIVNRSLGSRYDGPGDGRGALTSAAEYAVGRGITWINSAGNSAVARYYRQPSRVVGDLVAFGPSGSNTWLPFTGCIAIGGIRWANDWDLPPAERTDYDAFIYQAPIGNPDAGQLFASSTARQTAGAPPLENFAGGSACPAEGFRFYLQLRLVSGDPTGDVIEILDYADGLAAHTQAPHSAATPVVDARDAGVVAVGAVDPPDGGVIGGYSSQGPTNDGRIKPDVAAPSGADSVTFGASFSGTSASAPVVTGGAALLRQANLAADARSLGDLVRHSVVDRGPAGRDNVYGTGEFRLPDPPDVAVEAVPSRYVPLDAPARVLDTRPTSPIGPSRLIGDPWAGRILEVPVRDVPGVGDGSGVVDPDEVTAVAANVTLVEAERAGYVQAFPTERATLAGFSNSNVDAAGQTRPNLMVVPVGADGRYSIYVPAGGHVLVDVLGTFTATDGAVADGRVVGLSTAERVLDTRPGGVRVPSGDVVTFGLPGEVSSNEVAALVVNVTATETTGAGFIQALPGGRSDEIGRSSTLNLVDGATVANTVIVPIGDDPDAAVALYTDLGPGGSAHLIADVTAYVTSGSAEPSTAGRYVPVRPGRAFDSRDVGGPIASGSTADARAGAVPGVDLPADTSAIVWNFTATATTQPGFLTGWPVDGPEPPTSSLNWTLPGATVANAGIVAAASDGTMRIRVDGGPFAAGAPLADVVIDVFGYFT